MINIIIKDVKVLQAFVLVLSVGVCDAVGSVMEIHIQCCTVILFGGIQNVDE